jgi:hypothetical protein
MYQKDQKKFFEEDLIFNKEYKYILGKKQQDTFTKKKHVQKIDFNSNYKKISKK